MKVVINYQEYADVEVERAVLAEMPGLTIVESRTREPEVFAREAADAEGAIIQYVPANAAVIGAMAKCRVIVRYGIAVDTIDLAAARARGITVCNVPLYCLDEVSNHALALMLALHRRLPTGDRLLRESRHTLEAIRPIPRLKDCTLGLVAFGHIARVLAEKARPLFGEVMAADPFVSSADMAALGVKKAELDELFRRSDFISVHAPFTAATRHLVSAELIAAMKPTAMLVNTSRGPVVDEAALIDALAHNRIGGAGLDVFESEPLPPDSPLRTLDNVIITSHYAWYSEGAIRELKETAAREVLRVLRGEPPRHEVK
jgi:D-3-phosphoglycerate dehydrogenase / 2-oxoglutarate reductase